jgi:hypothetical protein
VIKRVALVRCETAVRKRGKMQRLAKIALGGLLLRTDARKEIQPELHN